MKLRCAVATFALLLAVATPFNGQTRRALLIGINLYQPPHTTAKHPPGCTGGRCDVTEYPNLEGSLNDVSAMRDLLASPKFGFLPQNVAVLTNPALAASPLPYVTLAADQTTRAGILVAMRKYLVDVPAKGDSVVFYYAGHGSLRVNSQATKLATEVNGKATHADNTLVAADAWLGNDDVLDFEMTHIFNAALDKGVRLTVLLDSCHSGGLTRGVKIGPQPRSRLLDIDPRDLNQAPDKLANGRATPVPSDRGALILAAAQEDQSAKESPPPDSVTEAHGAFTAALLNALTMLPADAPASAVYQQVRADMEGASIDDQDPSLDAGDERKREPLFGGAAEKPGKLRAAVVGSNNGLVVLDTGRLAGVGPNSTFVSTDDKGRKIILKVRELDGIARSKAVVLTPPGAVVNTGQLFELEKWVPVPVDPLHVWMWPSNLTLAQVQAAVAQVQAAGIRSVDDPASNSWTDLLSWDGTHWVIEHAGSSSTIALGPELTAGALRQHLAAGARLWVNLPPPKELVATLTFGDPASLVQATGAVENADYVLTGELTSDGPSWAWFHRTEFQKGPQSEANRGASAGCSATSHYPLRSDWVLLADASVVADAGGVLNTAALRLAKLNGWLHLPSSPGESGNYYRLAFEKADHTFLTDASALKPGEKPEMLLVSSAPVAEKRWVYVLDVDCRGKGQLLYPKNQSENRFPNDATTGNRIPLTQVDVSEPYGMDSIFYITTTEALPDPSTLDFEGVSTRGASEGLSAPPTPLQTLLSATSSGSRGLTPVLPTNWSISMGELRSVGPDNSQ